MPPTLGRAFPPDWKGYPPHMSTRDFQLWRRLQTAQPTLALHYYYDVALGTGAPPTDPEPEPIGGMWQRLTSFRADILADTGPGWLLIELRDNAGPGAFGSLLVYANLWAADPVDTRPVTLWLVTNHVHPDLRTILPKYDIHIELV